MAVIFNSGAVLFKPSGTVAMSTACCCKCANCDDAPAASLAIEFGGVGNADCTACVPQYAGVFILNRAPSDPCRYNYSAAWNCTDCDPGEYNVTNIQAWFCQNGGTYYLAVNVAEANCRTAGSDNTQNVAYFQKSFAGKPTCSSTDAISVPASTTGSCGVWPVWRNYACSWNKALATCTVSW